MAASQDRRLFWRSHAVDQATGQIVDRTPNPFAAKKKRQPRRQRGPVWATSGDFDRAVTNRRRKGALASKRRNWRRT